MSSELKSVEVMETVPSTEYPKIPIHDDPPPAYYDEALPLPDKCCPTCARPIESVVEKVDGDKIECEEEEKDGKKRRKCCQVSKRCAHMKQQLVRKLVVDRVSRICSCTSEEAKQ
ncbi:hypothetical protein M3Y98_01165300 [Aphelenchoides besseyi]|nr:hypothetical protein M3Y98_01165300 [Aphelenchoides besseyi]KAI6210909.1 hypothetical protein M3Y96_00377700 [Aphelenchoides besseyi]